MNLTGDAITRRRGLRVRPRQPRRARPRAVRHRARLGAQARGPGAARRSRRSRRSRPSPTSTRASRPRRRRSPRRFAVRGRARGHRRVPRQAPGAVARRPDAASPRSRSSCGGARLASSRSPARGSRCRPGSPTSARPGTGLWANVDPMEVAHIDAWRRDPERFWRFYGHALPRRSRTRSPTRRTRRSSTLERARAPRRGRHPEHRPAAPPGGHAELVEVHGIDRDVVVPGLRRAATRWPRSRARLDADREACRAATAARRSSPTSSCSASCCRSAAIERAFALAAGADLLLCIGSSLEVYPVAAAARRDAARRRAVAIVTQGPTPWDDAAPRSSLDGDVVEELQALVAALDGWRVAAAPQAAQSKPTTLRRGARPRGGRGRARRRPSRRRRARPRARPRRPRPPRAAASRSSSMRGREVAARRPRRRARAARPRARRAAAAPPRGGGRRSRSARARMASSSHASAASRPDSIAASRSSGRSAALRAAAAPPAGAARTRAPTGRRPPARPRRSRPGRRAPAAGDLAHRRVGGRGPVERGARRLRTRRSRDAVSCSPSRRPASARASPRGERPRRRSAWPAWSGPARAGLRRVARGPGPPAPPAPERALRRGELTGEHDDVRRLARVPAHDVAPVGGAELPGELELDEAEEPRSVANPVAPAARRARRRGRRASTSTATSGRSGSRSCPGGR